MTGPRESAGDVGCTWRAQAAPGARRLLQRVPNAWVVAMACLCLAFGMLILASPVSVAKFSAALVEVT